jgi:adenylosuccinate synthase
LEQAEVVYHEMPGWQTPTTGAKSYYDLPKKARDYVEVSTCDMYELWITNLTFF